MIPQDFQSKFVLVSYCGFNLYSFSGLKLTTSIVIASMIHFPPRPTLYGHLSVELAALEIDGVAFNMFEVALDYLRNLGCKNNFPDESPCGQIVYHMIEDLSHILLFISPGHSTWVSQKSSRRGAYVG